MWTKRTLGDLVRLQRGYDLTDAQRNPGLVPVMGSNGRNGWHDTARAPGPGVTVGRSGASAGVVTFVRGAYWPHNTVLFVTDFRGNNPRFIAYLRSTFDLANFNSGSAQPSLNRNFLYPIETSVPQLEEQVSIARSSPPTTTSSRTTRGGSRSWRRWRGAFSRNGSSISAPPAARACRWSKRHRADTAGVGGEASGRGYRV